jgi:hypothetical protein
MRLPLALLFASTISFTHLPPPAQQQLARLGIDAPNFPQYVAAAEADTAARERLGEGDHLIFYILQSKEFTREPPIEPALSARQFVTSKTIPAGVKQRIRDFLSAAPHSERLIYLRSLTYSSSDVEKEYRRVMQSLYAKEFTHQADFYQTRGHSTDTQISANYAVWQALHIVKAAGGQPIDHILIVGPGLDFAPRTGFDERYPPQSYQPYAIADALRSLSLSGEPHITAVDINSRVLNFFVKPPAELRLFTMPGDEEYLSYFRSLGDSIGKVRNVSPTEKTIQLYPLDVHAERLNIVTERLDRQYDLIIATNILVYLQNPHLLLAMANIAAMLKPGGYLIHNEIRPELDNYSEAAGLHSIAARTVRIGEGAKAPLFDAFALYRK